MKIEFKPQYYERVDKNKATIRRDLFRLKSLIEKSKRYGINTIESNEKRELIDEYGMEHVEAFKLKFVKED